MTDDAMLDSALSTIFSTTGILSSEMWKGCPKCGKKNMEPMNITFGEGMYRIQLRHAEETDCPGYMIEIELDPSNLRTGKVSKYINPRSIPEHLVEKAETLCEEEIGTIRKIRKEKSKRYGNIWIEWAGGTGLPGIFMEIHAKYARLKRMTWETDWKENKEAVADAFRDMVNYCIIALAVMKLESEMDEDDDKKTGCN